MANQIKFDVGFNVNKSDLNALSIALKNIQNEVNKASVTGNLTEELKAAGNAANQLQSILNQAWNSKLGQLDLSKVNNSIRTTYGSVVNLKNALEGSGAAGAAAYNKFASSVLHTNIQLKQSNKLISDMATTLGNTFRYGISSRVVNDLVGSLEKAFNYTVKLDTSLNDIRIVTDKSADSMEKFARQANDAAKSMSASTLDYTNAALIYYQQGLSDEEVAARTETTIKAANVTGQTGEEVSEQLTAVWNGYKVTAEETELYVDKLAAVAATTAADLEELSVGMSKVASAANAMGVDFDDLNAQIATIVSVTRQAPESVGTALKTIYARLGDLQVDGVDEFGVSLGKVGEQMAQMGIQILDQKGNLRDMSSVIAEVAEKWGGWTEAQKQAAAVAMAGKRQYNNLIALFDNWDMYTEALETSTEAVGTLQKQQDIYMESTEAHLQKLRTESQKTYDILFNQDTVNGFADALTGALGIFNNFIDAVGGGGKAFTALGAIATNVFSQQIGNQLSNLIINRQTGQSNQDLELLKKQVMEVHMAQGDNVSYEAANLEAQELQKTLEVQKGLTQEQYNELMDLQQKLGLHEQERLNLQKALEIGQDIVGQENAAMSVYQERLKIEQAELKNRTELTSSINNLVEASRLDLITQDRKNELMSQMRDLYQAHLITAEQINNIGKIDLSTVEGKRQLEQQLQQIFDGQNIRVQNQEQLVQQIIQAIEAKKSVEAGYEQQLLDEEIALQNQSNTIREQAQLRQNMQTYIQALSASVMLLQSISGIISVISNDEIEVQDKAKQITSLLLFSLPMIIMNLGNISTGLATLTTSMGLFATATEAAEAGILGMGAALIATPVGAIVAAIAAVTAAIFIGVKAYDAFTVSAKEAAEALEESVEEYKEARKELESLETELDKNNEKIKELQSQDSLTLIEEEELQNLQVANDLLQTQIDEQKELLKLKQAETVQNAKQAAEKDSYSTEKYRQITSGVGIASYAGNEKYKLDTSGISTYSELETKLKEVENIALEDAINEALSDYERMDAQAAYEYYQTEKDNILKAWSDATDQVKQAATKAQEVLPALYAEGTVDGKYDDESLVGDTIKYYEEKIVEYYKSSNSLERILTSIGKATFENDAKMQEFLKEAQTAINEETKTVDEKVLEGILGEEQFNNLQELAQKYQMSLFDIITYTEEYQISIDEKVEEIEETLESKIAKTDEFLGYLDTSLSAMTKSGKLTKKELEGMEEALKALEAEYPSLAAIQDRESTAYYNKLLAIREALEEQDKLLKQQQENQKIDEAKAITIDVESNGGEEALEEKLLDICNADYEVLVSVKSDIQTDFDTAVNAMESINEMASKIGDDFVVAAKDIEELNNVFPGILSNMELVGDGTVKLNADIVKGAMEVAEAEVAADTDATISKLQNQADELAVKRDAARQIATSATNLAKHETQLDDEKGKIDTALNQLKTDNSETTSQNQQKDQGDTAENAAQAATSMANSYGQAYQTMAADALKWATAARAALNYGSGLSDTPPSIPDFAGASFQTTSNVQQIQSEKGSLKDFEDYSDVGDWQEVADYYNNLADSYDEAYNSVIGKIGELTVRGQGVGKSLDNISKGLGSDGKKSGSSSSSKNKDKELKKLDEEFDRYWEINKALDAIDRNLKKIDKDQENLYGKELIRSLKQENELLDNQAQLYEQLYAAQQQEAAELRGQLSGMGVSFDESSGAILNYAEAVAAALATYNAAVTAFNNGPQDEAAQKSLEAAEKAYENFKKLIERYDTLVYNEMQETQDKLDDIWRKQLANNLKAWEVEIQLKLDFKQLERDWNDFIKEVTSDFKSVFKDLRVEVKNIFKDATTYIGSEGTINTIIDAVHTVTGEIDKLMGGGQSSMFESVSQAQEKLKELNTQLLESGQALHDLWKEAWDSYLDGIDQVGDKFDELLGRYERINEELEFQQKLIELLYGPEAYSLMSKYYEGIEKNTMGQIQSVKQQVDMWKELFNASGATMENQLNWDEDQKKYYEQWTEAQNKLNDLVLEYIQLLKNDYLNTVADVLNELEKYVTGSNLDNINTQWERISANAAKYYDSVEGAYQIQTLANKIDESIAKSSNLQAQQKLMKLREKEINYLREKENLTEYDIKAAEMRYQIALKEIALQEAQNNKTGMKLTRNEQGNWTYQYVADESDIASKQQELLDAYNNLYQLASDAYEANLEALTELQQKYIESAKQIYEDETLTEEERQQRLYELREWYLEQYKLLSEENQLYRNDLAASGSALLLEIYKQDEEAYEAMTEKERELVDALINANISDYQELDDAIKGNYQDISDSAKEAYQDIQAKSREVMSDTRQDWTSSAQQLADLWNKDNGSSVKTQVTKAYDQIEKANQQYQKAVDECARAVERDFTEEGIMGAIQKAENETDRLKDKTKELVEESKPYLYELKEYVNMIEEAWESVQQAIMDAINLIDEYLRKVGEVNAAQEQQAQIAQQQAEAAQAAAQAKNSGADKTKTSTTSDSSRRISPTASGYWYDTAAGSGRQGGGLFDTRTVTNATSITGTGKYAVEVSDGLTSKTIIADSDYLHRMGYKSFATGGYTGEWDSNGKLAILHQKELVLNKSDTSNFLSGIELMRNMVSNNGSIEKAVLKAAANMAYSLSNITPGTFTGATSSNSNNETVFNITAEFPNANNVEDIRQAILTLPNMASQYANSTLK